MGGCGWGAELVGGWGGGHWVVLSFFWRYGSTVGRGWGAAARGLARWAGGEKWGCACLRRSTPLLTSPLEGGEG